MHPADIKAAIAKAGSSQAMIARDLGVSPVTVFQTINNKIHSRRIATEIARVTGLSIDDLWTDQYPDKAA